MTRWFVVHLSFPHDAGEALQLQDLAASALTDIPSTGIEERANGWYVYFRSRAERDHAREVFEAIFTRQSVLVAALEIQSVDWAARTQAYHRAVRIGGIIVAPPWDIPAAGHETLVVIRPSMGFGTAHHASTRLCLRLLKALDVRGQTALDVGTGSGVLALAAVLRGASSAIGIDIDPDAIRAARANLVLNPTAHAVHFLEADLDEFDTGPVDLVLANLTGAQLVSRAKALGRLVKADGALIISGFLQDEEAEVREVYAPAGRVLHRLTQDGWVALQLTPGEQQRRHRDKRHRVGPERPAADPDGARPVRDSVSDFITAPSTFGTYKERDARRRRRSHEP